MDLVDHFWLVYFLEREKNGWEIVFEIELTYVTALVPSETACLASSPGNKSRTAVWISRDEIVCRLLYWANREASAAIRSIKKKEIIRFSSMEIYFLTYQKYH